MTEPIRIGIVGAGKNTRDFHIPGFQAAEDVEVVSVCNRSRESSQRVADQFGIPRIHDSWLDLVEDPDINAVCIGTWPYLHCRTTLAALQANKHVLCEARMAMNIDEARLMLEASRGKPHLVTQIVPSPFTFGVDATIKDLINEGFVGDLLAIDVTFSPHNFVNKEAPLTWRQDRDLSGNNILYMGIWYEALIRWVGHASEVTAMTSVNVPLRSNEEGEPIAVSVPDHVDILCRMACGAQARLRFSDVTGIGPKDSVWIHGSEGTLHLDPDTLKLYGGRRGEDSLKEITVPPEKQGSWRVEEEFVNSIRGLEKVRLTNFEDGYKYMELTEAVTLSASTGRTVHLPL